MTTPNTNDDNELVDLLYGELDPRARDPLEMRLASQDPHRRNQLEEWRKVRTLARRWRDATDAEPPAVGVDALMAAASAHVRKAPVAVATEAPRRSWWERVREWMAPLVAHPGLAAAASLVLVAGVVGVLYIGGDHRIAEPTAREMSKSEDQREVGGAAPAEPSPTMATRPAAPESPAGGDQPAEGPGGLRERATEERSVDKDRRDVSRRAKPGSSGAGRGAAIADGVDPFADTGPSSRGKAPPPKPLSVPPPPPPVESVPAPAAQPDVAPEATRPAPPRRPVPPATPAPATGAQEKKEKKSETSEAERLTVKARSAAREGQCAAVRTLSEQVKKIDPDYHRRRFIVDPDIGACFAVKK